jgi:hypothetical protein
VTFPTWLTITTVLTGVVIWYLAVAWCVPGTDRPGLALAVPAGEAGEPAGCGDDVHPAIPRSPAISASDPARRMAGGSSRARSMRDFYPTQWAHSQDRPAALPELRRSR